MDTTTLTITLPEPVGAFVAEQVAAGGYTSPSDYIAAVLREIHQRKAQEKLEALLLQGLDSEVAPMTPEDWEATRREGRERLAARRTS
jgi:antitoxin ParD1/3/4